jgi:hypothetical protein
MSISVHPDGRALPGPSTAGAISSAKTPETKTSENKAENKPSGTKIRSRLFTKYVALFVAVVAIALL